VFVVVEGHGGYLMVAQRETGEVQGGPLFMYSCVGLGCWEDRVWMIFDDVVIAVAGHALSQDEVVFHGLLANYFTACYHL
jgi:hypothetical protein